MEHADERGENYIAETTPADRPEPAVEAAEGLDFPGEERVNPEDLTAGGPAMSNETASSPTAFATAPPPLTPTIASVEVGDDLAAGMGPLLLLVDRGQQQRRDVGTVVP